MINHKIIFIINPKAGKKKNLDLCALIKNNFKTNFEFEIIVWDNKDDFDSIKNYVLNNAFTIAVAVGGDGTVNQVASILVNTDIALGIIPFGSGNGLARSLNIPMNTLGALEVLSKASISKIDSGVINGRPFFCTSGIGFDAHISKLFSSSTTRGLKSYIKIICKEFYSYSPQLYNVCIDGIQLNDKAFLISFANAGQYGNNFYIAPKAKMNDGEITMCLLKKFPIRSLPFLLLKLFRKKTEKSSYLKYINGKEITIKSEQPIIYHFDGEPGEFTNNINVAILPLSLNIVVNEAMY